MNNSSSDSQLTTGVISMLMVPRPILSGSALEKGRNVFYRKTSRSVAHKDVSLANYEPDEHTHSEEGI